MGSPQWSVRRVYGTLSTVASIAALSTATYEVASTSNLNHHVYLLHLTGQNQEPSYARHKSNGKLRYSWAVDLEAVRQV